MMIRLPSAALGRHGVGNVASPACAEWSQGHEWPLQPTTTGLEQSNDQGVAWTLPVLPISIKTRGESNRLEDSYDVDPQPVGEGGFGSVRCCRRVRQSPSAKTFAVKSVHTWNQQVAKMAKREISIHRTLKHPNICHLVEAFESNSAAHLVMEYIDGKDLLEWLQDKAFVGDLFFARAVEGQLIDALKYCHDLDVVHRDVKPENIMVSHTCSSFQVKLIDFGSATIVSEKEEAVEGTLEYLAPEVHFGGYVAHPSLDMWGAGLVLHALLVGYIPPKGEDVIKLDTSHKAFDFVPADAKLLLAGLMQTDPLKRFTAAQALCSSWVTHGDDEMTMTCWDTICSDTCSTDISSDVDFAESPRSNSDMEEGSLYSDNWRSTLE